MLKALKAQFLRGFRNEKNRGARLRHGRVVTIGSETFVVYRPGKDVILRLMDGKKPKRRRK